MKSAGASENLDKLAGDYEELAAARGSAYEAGIDGAQWILDNFGISLGDFQQVTMQWMQATQQEGYETSRHLPGSPR